MATPRHYWNQWEFCHCLRSAWTLPQLFGRDVNLHTSGHGSLDLMMAKKQSLLGEKVIIKLPAAWFLELLPNDAQRQEPGLDGFNLASVLLQRALVIPLPMEPVTLTEIFSCMLLQRHRVIIISIAKKTTKLFHERFHDHYHSPGFKMAPCPFI